MKFELVDSLIIVNIQHKNYLVDTGSNLSFSLNADLDLVINDTHYQLKSNLASNIVKDALNHLIPGKVVDGVIGTDIICKTNLSIDYLNERIYFNIVKPNYDIEQYQIPFQMKLGYIFIHMNKLSMLIDSGAKIGYVKSKYLDLSNPVSKYEDYSPELGFMRGSLYDFFESIHQENILVGKLPKQYEFICDGIIPLYEFVRPGFVTIDFKNHMLSFTRRFI